MRALSISRDRGGVRRTRRDVPWKQSTPGHDKAHTRTRPARVTTIHATTMTILIIVVEVTTAVAAAFEYSERLVRLVPPRHEARVWCRNGAGMPTVLFRYSRETRRPLSRGARLFSVRQVRLRTVADILHQGMVKTTNLPCRVNCKCSRHDCVRIGCRTWKLTSEPSVSDIIRGTHMSISSPVFHGAYNIFELVSGYFCKRAAKED